MKNYPNINLENKKARFNYNLLNEYQAGLELLGTEIKSIRNHKVSISESFCQFKNNELYIVNMMIDQYVFGTHSNHSPKRERKLLLKKNELNKLFRKIKHVNLSIIPIKLYINKKGLAKIIIALAKSKKKYDKRQAIKDRDLQRITKQAKI